MLHNYTHTILVYTSMFFQQELHLKSMIEEITALRQALADKEETMSKLRLELHTSNTRIIDYKVELSILN